jgi:hypothetical protein
MMKIITFGRCFLFMAGLLAFAAIPLFSAYAEETGGYEGLIAPAAPDDTAATAAANKDEEPGYSGVVSGAVPRETPPMFTPIPGRPGPSQDAEFLANLYARDKDNDGVPDKITNPKKVSLTGFHPHIKGKSATEYMVEQNIESAMNDIKDTTIPVADRVANAKQAYEDLSSLAEGLRNKKMVPDRTYQQMGLPDSYITETKIGIDNSLAALDKTLAELREYQ